jgi:hypothetical protein
MHTHPSRHRASRETARARPAAEKLGRFSVVVAKPSAQSLPTTCAPVGPCGAERGRDDCVVEPLVIPLRVVVSDVFTNCPS